MSSGDAKISAEIIQPALAAQLAAEHYSLSGEILALPSYIDFNFKLQTDAGKAYVIKFANPASDVAILEMENAAMRHLAAKTLPFSHPTLLASQQDEDIVAVAGDSETRCFMRIISWLDGELYADVSPHSVTLQASLGVVLADSAIAFADFAHSAAHRTFQWDIAQLAELRPLLALHEDKQQRELLTGHFDHFCNNVLPAMSACPQQIIHNDGNDYNLLTTTAKGHTRCSGLIDFGDMVYSYRVCDLAIAMTYALFDQHDVATATRTIVSGYEQRLELLPAEKDCLYDLITARLVQSLLLSTQSYRANPDNDYLLVSAQPAWQLLEFLHAFGAEKFRTSMRAPAG